MSNVNTESKNESDNEEISPKSVKEIETKSKPSTTIGVYYTPKFLDHRAPPSRDHPECPERLTVCVNAIKNDPELSEKVKWYEPQAVEDTPDNEIMKAIREVHTNEEYLDELRSLSKSGGALDSDTYVAPGSWEIALLSTSAWISALKNPPSFALSRPPGHHSTPQHGMGFCLLSNAAITAKYASTLGYKKISIFDFDVHHGNGTELAIKNESNIKFVSTHQYPLYPMSGEENVDDNVMNLNFVEGSTIDDYLPRFSNEIVPHLLHDNGHPDLIVISAGYDALDDDPLAGLCFNPQDFGVIMKLLLEKFPNTDFVLGLEGGYSLAQNGISAGVCETLRAFFR